MELIVVGKGEDRVWINPSQIEWFWEYDGVLTVKFSGENKMQSYPDCTAEQFARMIQGQVGP